MTEKERMLKDRIFQILKNVEPARCDDFIVYAELLKTFDLPNNIKTVLIDSFYNHIDLQLPNLHSVIRRRQEIQRYHPELTNKTAVKARKEKERRMYQEYSKRR